MFVASSSTALANLAYLIGAVVVAIIGGLIVWLRHRQPKSVDANMASFRRGLDALAPDSRSASTAQGRPEQFKIRPMPAAALSRVRLGAEHSEQPGFTGFSEPQEDEEDPGRIATGAPAAEEPAGEPTGGQGG